MAVNSCTAALHLAVEALGLKAGQAVLVPAMTFAATAEVVRYQGADPDAGRLRPRDPEHGTARRGPQDGGTRPRKTPGAIAEAGRAVGVIPVHVGGWMMDTDRVAALARGRGLWVVEDAAHAFPRGLAQGTRGAPWRRCGEETSAVSCFSFYANKTITTGEGGMAVTDDEALAGECGRCRFTGCRTTPGSGTRAGGAGTIASSPRLQVQHDRRGRRDRHSSIGQGRGRCVASGKPSHDVSRGVVRRREIELPPERRIASTPGTSSRSGCGSSVWRIDRNAFIDAPRMPGSAVRCTGGRCTCIPITKKTFGWKPEHLPTATAVWERLISLPLFPGMREGEIEHVISAVRRLCERHASPSSKVAVRGAKA